MNKCEIVNDLLPAYIDEVISPSGKEYVDEHLTECANCTAALSQMKTDIEEKKTENAENTKAKNPFKKIKVKKLVISTACFLVGVLAVLYGIFLIDGYVNYGYDGLSERLGMNVLEIGRNEMLKKVCGEIGAGDISQLQLDGGALTRTRSNVNFSYNDKKYYARCNFVMDGVGSVSLTYYELYEYNKNDGYHIFGDGTLLYFADIDADSFNGIATTYSDAENNTQVVEIEAYSLFAVSPEEYAKKLAETREKYKGTGTSEDAIQAEVDQYVQRRSSKLDAMIIDMRSGGIPENAIEEWISK